MTNLITVCILDDHPTILDVYGFRLAIGFSSAADGLPGNKRVYDPANNIQESIAANGLPGNKRVYDPANNIQESAYPID